jgi:Arc/MetJ-type ribon-helix-helix transcriptional regulator
MSERIAVRIPQDLAESLDELVSSGRFETKAEAIRTALEALVKAERRGRVGALIADGYRRLPQDDLEVEVATRAAIRSMHDEPW